MGAAASTKTILVPKSDEADDLERYALAKPAGISMPLDVLEQIATVYLHAVSVYDRFWAAVLLSQINRQMRAILLCRGTYWSDIFIDPYRDLRAADMALMRSAGAPLRVKISDVSWRPYTPDYPDAERIVRNLFFTAEHVERIQHLVATWLPDGLEPPGTSLGGTHQNEGTPFVYTPKALRILFLRNVQSCSLFEDWVGDVTSNIRLEPLEVGESLVRLERMASNAPNLQSLRFGSLYALQAPVVRFHTGRLQPSNTRSRGPLVELLIGEPAVEETAFPTLIELVQRQYPGTLRDARLIVIDPSIRGVGYVSTPRLPFLGIQEITERCNISIDERTYSVVYHPSGRMRVFWALPYILHGDEQPQAKGVWRHLISCADSLHMHTVYALEFAEYMAGIRAVPGLCSTLRELRLDILKSVLCDIRLFANRTSTPNSPRIALSSLTMLILRPTERDYTGDGTGVWSMSTDKEFATEMLPIVGRNWAWIINQFDLPQSERAKVKWANDVQEYDRQVFTELVDRAWRGMTDEETFFGSV